MPLIIIAAGVALLLVLMIGFKVNGFIALFWLPPWWDLPKGWARKTSCTPYKTELAVLWADSP